MTRRYHLLLHHWIVSESCEPVHVGLVAKPCQLPFRIMAHVQRGLLNRTFQIAIATEKLNDPPVTMGAKSIGVSRHSARQQAAHFFYQSISEMLRRPLIDAVVQLVPPGIQHHYPQATCERGWFRSHWPLL